MKPKSGENLEPVAKSKIISGKTGGGRTIHLPLPVTLRVALKATLLSPTMLLLLALGAISTFLSISYMSAVIAGYSMPYMLSLYYGTYGAEGLSPAFVLMQWLHLYVVVLTPLLLFVSVPLGYGVSNAVAEDVGATPENLLLSRPVSRWRYLLCNYAIRSALTILIAFVVPFLLAYPGAVSALESSGSSYITTKMTLEQWTQLAWGAPLTEVIILYSSVFLVVSAIGLAIATVWRRGAVAVPAVLIVAGVGPTISMLMYFFAAIGGYAPSLTLLLHIVSPFRLFTGELNMSYSFTNLLVAPTVWWVFLLAFSIIVYSRAQVGS